MRSLAPKTLLPAANAVAGAAATAALTKVLLWIAVLELIAKDLPCSSYLIATGPGNRPRAEIASLALQAVEAGCQAPRGSSNL